MGLKLSKLFPCIFAKKEIQIVMVGLDAAGKTTILYNFKLGRAIRTIPTVGFNIEVVKHKNIAFTVWDVGGQENIRPLWTHYLRNAEGLVFVVDSNDRERIGEAKDLLHKMLSEDDLKGVSLLVFANKQDFPNAMNTAEIIEKLDLQSLSDCCWYVQNSCATSGEGLFEGLDWLSKACKN
ncbi:hypothetical protein SUGI_0574090 [Cryptomeria japonica]|uniref:ADP-ribosylation factor 1 n=1 Tax=Cryptomeria japonica TaxID=3369 RepID=UPI002408D18E|nr:ADP-ribosylation factor 1 [Cryptomeria japonica]GLJ29122.1 hypothetical protein SUGI_0574090 [Cryptomeria japonica]